jgi:hypothetical protein
MRLNKENFKFGAFALILGLCFFITLYRADPSDTIIKAPKFKFAPAFDKITVQYEDDDQEENLASSQNLDTLVQEATSGHEFSGLPFRTFPPNRVKFKDNVPVSTKSQLLSSPWNCTKWAVVTTIFSPPQESVRRFLYRKDWCVVIVGDQGKPKVRQTFFTRERSSKGLLFTLLFFFLFLLLLLLG